MKISSWDKNSIKCLSGIFICFHFMVLVFGPILLLDSKSTLYLTMVALKRENENLSPQPYFGSRDTYQECVSLVHINVLLIKKLE